MRIVGRVRAHRGWVSSACIRSPSACVTWCGAWERVRARGSGVRAPETSCVHLCLLLPFFFYLGPLQNKRAARGRRELGLVGNNNWYQSIGFGGARRRWRSSRAAAEHGDAGRAESAAAAADLCGDAEAAVARRGSADGRPSSGTRRIGRVGRVGARSWRGLVACGAWQNKPRRRAHRVGRVYGRASDVASASGPRECVRACVQVQHGECPCGCPSCAWV